MYFIPTSTKEHAALVYRKVLANTLVRGRSIAVVTAASLFAACRMSGTQRTLKDVSAASGIRKKDLAKCYRLLVKTLDLHMPVVDPVRCVSKIATAVKISMPTQQHAIRIINEAKKRGLVAGKDPMGLRLHRSTSHANWREKGRRRMKLLTLRTLQRSLFETDTNNSKRHLSALKSKGTCKPLAVACSSDAMGSRELGLKSRCI